MASNHLNPDSRQCILARHIGIQFHDCNQLVPTNRPGTFSIMPMTQGIWTDERASDLAWWAVAKQLDHLSGNSHIIDHAWLVSYAGRPTESWALVTEPYADEARERALTILADDAMSDWFLDVHVLDRTQSSWSPGACVPIVATFQRHCAPLFIRSALLWALDGRLT